MAPDGKVPVGTLIGGHDSIHKTAEKFFKTRI